MFIHDKIINIKAYEPITGCFISKSNEFWFGVDKIKFDGNLFAVFRFGDSIIVLDEVNRAFIFEDYTLKAIGYDFRIGSLKYPMIAYYKKEQPRKYGILDFSSQSILFETNNWIGKDIFEEFIFAENQGVITCRRIYSAQPLWQFDLGSLGSYKNIINEIKTYEVKHFLGMHDGVLLVQLSNATFLFLDGKTGVLKHKVCLNESYALPNPVFYDDAFKAHLANGKLILLNNQRLLEINLTSYAVRIIRNYYQEPRENQYRFMQSTYFDGNIYFVADFGWQYVTPSYIGVMEAKTGEILWKLQLENTGGLSEAPQVTKDRLYIRTNNNVLHIFEKET